MLSNCEKMVVISSTTNEWPQNHQIDEKNLMASTGRVMEKAGQEPPQQQQQPALKCPRCDSSNTKFCYYNNYSLSQPRHFCKACKRYWTKGGTLRNVPVGGGCRKNKRVKRPASANNSIDGSNPSAAANPNNSHSQPQIDISSTSNHINPLFFRLSTNPSDMNLPFSTFNSRVVSSLDTISGYDLQPQLNAPGLGFSSGLIMSNTDVGDCNYRNGFNPNKQIHEVVTSSNSLLSSYPTFGSSSSSPTIASLLASSLHQPKFMNGVVKSTTEAPNHFNNNLASFQDLQMTANNNNNTNNGEAARIGMMKEVKAEEGQNRMDWNVECQNQMEQIGLPDPSLYWNPTNSVGAWHDPSNIGSSVTSFI